MLELAIGGAIFLALAVWCYRSRAWFRGVEVEDGRYFQVVGGARLNFWFTSWPFAVLSVSEKCVWLRVLGRVYELPKRSIHTVWRVHEPFGLGLSIEHTARGIPADVKFGSFDMDRVMEAFRARGYAVQEKARWPAA